MEFCDCNRCELVRVREALEKTKVHRDQLIGDIRVVRDMRDARASHWNQACANLKAVRAERDLLGMERDALSTEAERHIVLAAAADVARKRLEKDRDALKDVVDSQGRRIAELNFRLLRIIELVSGDIS